MTVTDLDFVARQAFLELVARGDPPAQACKRIGISKRAINALLAADPEFAEDYREAMEVMVGRVDDTIYRGAIDGDNKKIEFFLREHKPHLFPSTKQAGTGSGASPTVHVAHISVQIAQALVMGEQSDEWLRTLHAPREAIEATATEVVDGEPGP